MIQPDKPNNVFITSERAGDEGRVIQTVHIYYSRDVVVFSLQDNDSLDRWINVFLNKQELAETIGLLQRKYAELP